MAQLVFLGIGGAFVMPQRVPGGGWDCVWQSNLLLQTGYTNILLDCGTDIRFALAEQGLSERDINGAYVSHTHADHCGGLEWLAFNTKFDPGRESIPVLIATHEVLSDLRRSVLPGLSPVDGRDAELRDFFMEVQVGEKPTSIGGGGVAITPVRAVHVHGVPDQKFSFGLFIQGPGRKVFWTSDCMFQPDTLMPWYEKADLVLHDCEIGLKSGVHAHLDDICTLPQDVREKMILYHYNPARRTPEVDDRVQKMFPLGFARKGQVIEL